MFIECTSALRLLHRFVFGRFLIAALALMSCATGRTAPFPCSYAAARDAGWAEAVFKVRDPQIFAKFARQVAGWQVTTTPEGEWLLHDAEYGVGVIRVLHTSRPAPPLAVDRPWDTGGLFSVMTRSNDLNGAYAAATALGWGAANVPVSLDFGGVTLANVVLRGPSAANVAIYERLQPRMPDAPDLQKLRRPFNSMQVVRNLAEAKNFYVDLLGFSNLGSGRFRAPPGSPSNFGIPPSMSNEAALDYMILAPAANGPTQIEVVSFVGVDSRPRRTRDLEAAGLVALRFPVRSLEALRQRLSRARYPFETAKISLPPYGTATAIRVRSPEGAQLEFFSPGATDCR